MIQSPVLCAEKLSLILALPWLITDLKTISTNAWIVTRSTNWQTAWGNMWKWHTMKTSLWPVANSATRSLWILVKNQGTWPQCIQVSFLHTLFQFYPDFWQDSHSQLLSRIYTNFILEKTTCIKGNLGRTPMHTVSLQKVEKTTL